MSYEISADPVGMANVCFRSAMEFIAKHHCEHLNSDEALVNRCTIHLSTTFRIACADATEVTLRALAQHQAQTVPALIDIDRSTSYLVRVLDMRTGAAVVFSASELLRLAREKAAARPVHTRFSPTERLN